MFVGFNNNYRPYTCQMDKIYRFLGKKVYVMLEEVELPEGHLTLNTCLLMLMCGYSFPVGHLELKDLLKKALEEVDTEEEVISEEIDQYVNENEV